MSEWNSYLSPHSMFNLRPSWNATFISAIKTIRTGASVIPNNVSMIRMLTDYDIPTWLPNMPSGVKMMRSEVAQVPGEWYYPSEMGDKLDITNIANQNCIMYIHGGAFCCCKSGTHRELLYRLVKATNSIIFSVDYRRAPEYPYPAPVEDCIIAFMYLVNIIRDPKKIIFGGDSAGGNLVISTLVTMVEKNYLMPAAGILLSPWVDLSDIGERESWKLNRRYDLISRRLARLFANSYLEPGSPLTLKDVSPLYYDNLDKLPPILIEVGDCEVLRDQIVAFADRLKALHVPVICNVRPDMTHVFPILHFTGMPQCADFFTAAGEFCQNIFPQVEIVDQVSEEQKEQDEVVVIERAIENNNGNDIQMTIVASDNCVGHDENSCSNKNLERITIDVAG